MNLRAFARRALHACAVLFVLAVAWWCTSDGLRNLRYAHTMGQQLEALLRLACGLLSVAVVVTRYWWPRGSRPARVGWAVTLAAPAGLAALVWGPPAVLTAILNVIVALLVGWGVLWALGPALAAQPAPAAAGHGALTPD